MKWLLLPLLPWYVHFLRFRGLSGSLIISLGATISNSMAADGGPESVYLHFSQLETRTTCKRGRTIYGKTSRYLWDPDSNACSSQDVCPLILIWNYTDSICSQKPMTPFESLLWNIWLPKVRTAINNEWSPKTPQPAIRLYEAWSTFLPPFIRDNMLDQLILPKVQKAIADWNMKIDHVSLETIVFPWLPHVGLRLEDFVGDARRKVKSLLRHWNVGNELPAGLKAWKDVSACCR
jgi:hypothetical protein